MVSVNLRRFGAVAVVGLCEPVVVMEHRVVGIYIALQFVFLAMVVIGIYRKHFACQNMGKLYKVLIPVLFLFFVSSCSSREEGNLDSVRYFPLRATKEVEDLSPYISDIELIKVGSDNFNLPSISKIIISEPCILLSGGVVYSSSKDFKNIERVGNVGRGPGEYLSIKDIAIDSNSGEILCLDVLNSVLRYDLRTLMFLGKTVFQRNERDYARAMIPQKNNTIALYTPNPDGNVPQGNALFYCLNYYTMSGKEIDRQMLWTEYNVMAGFSNPVSVIEQGVYVLSPESSNVSYIFNDNGIDHQIVLDFGSKWIPSNFFDPKDGDPVKKIGDLFERDCFKLISSVYFSEDNLYLHAYGKESSSWNFFLSKDGSNGIRWRSIGVSSPPISAIASDGEYLYFPYDDYGLIDIDEDPLKKCILQKYGMPIEKNVSSLIKIKLHVN